MPSLVFEKVEAVASSMHLPLARGYHLPAVVVAFADTGKWRCDVRCSVSDLTEPRRRVLRFINRMASSSNLVPHVQDMAAPFVSVGVAIALLDKMIGICRPPVGSC